MTAELATFPIDTTKTRLQIQGQVISKSLSELKYRGMLHAMYRITKEEGFRCLYNGISPALLRQGTYGTIKIGLYHGIKNLIVKNQEEETLYYNMVAGIAAGAISSSICNPTDVLKVRLQAQTKGTLSQKQRTMFSMFADIYQQEGFKGLYRGVGPTAQRASVIAGVELPVYDWCKRKFITLGILGDTAWNHFIASIVAGLAGAIASNPIDVVKTRMMNQRNFKGAQQLENVIIYKSSLDCFYQTAKTEGFMALYKGFIPTFVRLCPWNIVFFMSFEQYRRLGEKF